MLHDVHFSNGWCCEYRNLNVARFFVRFGHLIRHHFRLQTNKKGEVLENKVKTQSEVVLPVDMREHARLAFDACKGKSIYSSISSAHRVRLITVAFFAVAAPKDYCEKSYALVHCMYEYDPAKFYFA